MSMLYVFELIDWTDAHQLKQRAPTIRMVTGCVLTNWHKVVSCMLPIYASAAECMTLDTPRDGRKCHLHDGLQQYA